MRRKYQFIEKKYSSKIKQIVQIRILIYEYLLVLVLNEWMWSVKSLKYIKFQVFVITEWMKCK